MEGRKNQFLIFLNPITGKGYRCWNAECNKKRPNLYTYARVFAMKLDPLDARPIILSIWHFTQICFSPKHLMFCHRQFQMIMITIQQHLFKERFKVAEAVSQPGLLLHFIDTIIEGEKKSKFSWFGFCYPNHETRTDEIYVKVTHACCLCTFLSHLKEN